MPPDHAAASRTVTPSHSTRGADAESGSRPAYRKAHEDDGDCRNCGTSNVGCWSIAAFNAQFCCGKCDHGGEGK